MSTPEAQFGDAGRVAIRPAGAADFDALWPMLCSVIRAGETYAIDPGLSRAGAYALWMEAPRATYVAEVAGKICGTFYV